MPSKSVELALECQRLSESCLYTSTSLLIWLRFLRTVRVVFIVVPLFLGSLAGWKLLTGSELAWVKIVTAVSAFLAGLFPLVHSAVKLDNYLKDCAKLAGEFKNLQDRFRQAALVSSKKSFSEFERDVKPLVERLEKARSRSITPPETCFRRAKKNIKAGDYAFDIDVDSIDRNS
jgi:hypothetical protein